MAGLGGNAVKMNWGSEYMGCDGGMGGGVVEGLVHGQVVHIPRALRGLEGRRGCM